VIVVGGVGTRQGVVHRDYHDHAEYEATLRARVAELSVQLARARALVDAAQLEAVRLADAARRDVDQLAVRGTVIRTGRLTVDLIDDAAYLGGRRLDMVPSEWALLAALARHVGRVVSRDDLVAVWAAACRTRAGRKRRRADPYPLLRASVMRLRSRLGELGPALVETRRGAGYLLRQLPAEL
jgi:DNA-binding response OmpR family regulator